MSQPVFPAPGSIPPADPRFYNLQGLTNWLNNNPTYKGYFVMYDYYFPYLYSQSTINSLISTSQIPGSSIYRTYKLENVSLAPLITNLSQYQAMKYKTDFDLFLRVYAFNSTAYTQPSPVYYRFQTYNEYTNYKSGLAIANKLYPFDLMANGTNEFGSTLNWRIPFPL
jgi:hypothetical protein